MAFFISPGVQVREFDISSIVTQSSTSSAAYVGAFEWGPVEEVTVVGSKALLQKRFGNPTDENALHWFSCANFLDYSNNLKLIRVVNEDIAKNATVAGHAAALNLKRFKETSNIDGLNDKLDKLTAEGPRLRAQKQGLTNDLTMYKDTLKPAAEQAVTTTAADKALKETAQQAADAAVQAAQGQIATWTTELATLQQEKTTLTNELATLNDDVVAKQGVVNTKKGVLDAAKAEVTRLEALIVKLTGELAALTPGTPEHDAKQLELTQAQNDKTAADAAVVTAQGEYDAAVVALNAAKQAVTDKTNEISAKDAEIAAKTKDISDKTTELATLQAALALANTELEDAKKAEQAAIKRLADIDAKILELTDAITAIDAAIAKNATDLSDTKALLDQLTATLKEKEKAVRDATVYIKNQSNWTEKYSFGKNGVGEFAAKYPSDLGSNLAVYMADANTYSGVTAVTMNVDSYIYEATDNGLPVAFTRPTGISAKPEDTAEGEIVLDLDNPDTKTGLYRIKEIKITKPGKGYRVAPDVTIPKPLNNPTAEPPKGYARLWKYANQFLSPPNTSNWVRERGGKDDELHIVVVDETGVLTGKEGQVLERFANVSKASDARFDDTTSAYYVAVLRDQSQYVYWMDHPEGMTNWGLEARNIAFKPLTANYEGRLGGGVSGSKRSEVGNAELIRGWDNFSDTERVDVGILITGPADRILQSYVLNIAETRMDCVAVMSPEQGCVVKNSGNELNKMLHWREVMKASSYGFADCNWKYQYDVFNDKYRWIPCNPDIAGLMARTDYDHDPWWSPAGFNRGHIKNVVKLAWNPGRTERDEMYAVSINPVCSFLNEGVILYGDKTMLLKVSGFSRINVRRLFIVLEKSIATAAKYMLFEFNDDFTRMRFRQMVEPFLRDVKGRRGMYAYQVRCDASNNTPQVVDANAFVADVMVKPTKSINFVQLNMVCVATGVAFEEIVGSFGDF